MIDKIADKVIPTLIIAIIFAIFGLFMRVGYLEYTAESSISRYVEDMREYKLRLDRLEDQVVRNKEELIRREK